MQVNFNLKKKNSKHFNMFCQKILVHDGQCLASYPGHSQFFNLHTEKLEGRPGSQSHVHYNYSMWKGTGWWKSDYQRRCNRDAGLN